MKKDLQHRLDTMKRLVTINQHVIEHNQQIIIQALKNINHWQAEIDKLEKRIARLNKATKSL